MTSAYTAGMRYGAKRGRFEGRARVKQRMVSRALNARTGGYLGLELKFLDTAWNAVTINSSTDGSGGELQPSSGCTSCISCPAQGDSESQRDGRKFVIKSVYFSGVINTLLSQDQADAFEDFGVYFALVLDTQTNGATVVSENVYLNPSSSALGMLPKPLRNLQNSKRFRILSSRYVAPGGMYAINDAAATGSLAAQKGTNVQLSWKGSINVDTTGTTADVASVSDNALHILAYSETGLQKVFSGKCRVRFMG